MIPAVDGWHGTLAALLLLFPRSSPAADDLPGAARELARKAAAFAAGRGPAAVTYRNLSSLPDSEMTAVRRELETGLPGGDGPPALELRITLSDNLAERLLVAEARKGDDTQVWIASWKRARPAPSIPTGAALDRKLVWEQEEQILDIAFPGDSMLVLAPSKLTLYARQGTQWQARQTAAIPAEPWPRDLRGRLRVVGTNVQVYLPGVACSGRLDPLSLNCGPSDEPWVLESGSRSLLLAGFAPTRNYFDGRVTLQNGSRKSVAPFYAAAAFEEPGTTLWLLSALDGRTQIYDGSFEPAGSIPSWGSDLVGTAARCGGGSQVLATRPGDANEPDAVQAFAIVNGTAVALAAPAIFPGPVTALWPSAAAALAVSRDPSTGKYAAYVLTLVCGS